MQSNMLGLNSQKIVSLNTVVKKNLQKAKKLTILAVYKSCSCIGASAGASVPSLHPSQRPQHLHTPLKEG